MTVSRPPTAVISNGYRLSVFRRMGPCYGGYMTMWAVTQTTRFKAAVAGAGIANWQSYYGQNRLDTWMLPLPFFGASVYDKPEAYSRSSPITFIKKAKTEHQRDIEQRLLAWFDRYLMR